METPKPVEQRKNKAKKTAAEIKAILHKFDNEKRKNSNLRVNDFEDRNGLYRSFITKNKRKAFMAG